MALLKKDVTVPLLPQNRVVAVPELGGEVIVRPLLLADRLRLVYAPGSKDYGHVAELLSSAVLDANGEQLFTLEQWEAWGSLHFKAALDLFQVAYDVSGIDGEPAEKNSKAQSSS